MIYLGSRCSLTGNLVQDLVFVIDACGSFSSVINLIREFTANITVEIIHNFPSSAVGLISNAHIQFNLQAYTTLNPLLSAINRGVYSGFRDIDEAINLLLSAAQNGALRLRSNSSKVAIFITTTQYSSSCYMGSSAVAALHASNIFDDIYAIGFGRSIRNDLEAIASSPELVFNIYDYYLNTVGIQQLQNRFLKQLCNGKAIY